MKTTLRILIGATCAMAVCATAFAAAPQYPTRSVRLIVPFAPGGPTDTIARLMANHLTEALKHQVIVDNRAGAGGNIGMGLAADAAPDGHTLLLVSSSFVVNPSLYKKIPYDPFKSFAFVTNVAASPNVFTAHPSSPVRSISDLIKSAQSNPGKYNIATPGIGTTPDLSARLLALTTKVDLTAVPYGGAGPAVSAVVGNQVSIGCTAMPPTTPHIQGGRLRALAVTSAKRSEALPDVPTMAEAGYKGQEAETLQGMLVPAGTPKEIVSRLHSEVARIMAMPDVRKRVVELGFYIIVNTPAEFAAQAREEVEKWGKVIRTAKIEVQ